MAYFENLIINGLPEWPYPIRWDNESDVNEDILVIGGGMAGCFAAITAASQGVKIATIAIAIAFL